MLAIVASGESPTVCDAELVSSFISSALSGPMVQLGFTDQIPPMPGVSHSSGTAESSGGADMPFRHRRIFMKIKITFVCVCKEYTICVVFSHTFLFLDIALCFLQPIAHFR